MKPSHPTPGEWAQRLLQGERRALAQAITLLESQRREDQQVASQLFASLAGGARRSFRLGITGAPGAGKSTLIEALGLRLCNSDRKVAVLAVDPSSSISGGSILGDKTRMTGLSLHPSAFIRPSPSLGITGGLGVATGDAVRLCEAAGYDFIIIETMGVGQGELDISDTVDAVLMLMDPGGGDGLQAVKRGLLELADLVAITKADGERLDQAAHTLAEFQAELAHRPSRLPGYDRDIMLTSVHDTTLLAALQDRILAFESAAQNHLQHWRQAQSRRQLQIAIERAAARWASSHSQFHAIIDQALSTALAPDCTAALADRALVELLQTRTMTDDALSDRSFTAAEQP